MVNRKASTIHEQGSHTPRGKAIAIRLAADGFDICVNDIQTNSHGINEVVAHIHDLNHKAIGVIADVSHRSEVETLIQKSVEALGPLDVTVANAGIAQVKSVLELTEYDVERMFRVNMFGVFNCYQVATKQIIEQGTNGKLVGAASLPPLSPLFHYSASKWAVPGLTQAFALEVATHGMTCNAYAPGIVGTAMCGEMDEAMGRLSGAAKGETIERNSEEILMGRVGVPEDVAETFSYLSGKGSDYMTGQTLIIDGGMQFS